MVVQRTKPLVPGKPPQLAERVTELAKQQAAKFQKLATEPLLEHLGLKATANDHTIVLSVGVDNEQQHKLALRIAQSYAGERQIVDKITMRD